MAYLVLDTDVWSFLHKGDTRAEQYRLYLQGHTLCISFQTVAELYRWALTKNWGQRRVQQLELAPRDFVVLPYDNAVAMAWAKICTEREKAGQPIGAQDAWVAACAIRHNCPLVTHNAADYIAISDLQVITAAG